MSVIGSMIVHQPAAKIGRYIILDDGWILVEIGCHKSLNPHEEPSIGNTECLVSRHGNVKKDPGQNGSSSG